MINIQSIYTAKKVMFLLALTISLNNACTREWNNPYDELGSKAVVYGDSVTDIDGNTYKTVVIGTQIWMGENLKVTKYANGTAIPHVTEYTAWGNLGDNDTDKGYCFYNNDKSLGYGALYTYAAATNGDNSGTNVQGVCPNGWHLPSDDEWKTLEMHLGMSQSDADDTGWRVTTEGKKLKATEGWNSNENGTDEVGYTALAGGFRDSSSGTFYHAGYIGYWWCSTQHASTHAYARGLNSLDSDVHRDVNGKSYGFSVRCLKGNGVFDTVLAAAFVADATKVMAGGVVSFTDQSTNSPITWVWDFGDGKTSIEQNPKHTYATPGTYTVSLTVSNSAGSDTETKMGYIEVEKAINYGSVTDIDNNTYKTVVIGTQTWMAENLKVTRYANGTAIPYITDITSWDNLEDIDTDKAYCFYNNDESLGYGALYTYAAATNGDNSGNSVQGVCPTGWHLPSDAEWSALTAYLSNNGHSGSEGTALKTTSGWNYNGNGTDDYGFSALADGYRHSNGAFYYMSSGASWWSSTQGGSSNAYGRGLYYGYADLARGSSNKSYGRSVRCLRD